MEQINLNKNVKIEFTPEQIGIVLAVLRKQSYEQVVDVITSIQGQVIEQAREKPPRIPEFNPNGANKEMTHE